GSLRGRVAGEGEAVRPIRGRLADGLDRVPGEPGVANGEAHVTRYTSATDADRTEMLAAIGVGSTEELFADIPAGVRLDRPLALGDGLSEQEVFEEFRALAARNISAEDEISFLGAGMYDHYVPALVDSIIMRSEFLTDRKSTRLNSSHLVISYAVFCLKKKKTIKKEKMIA